MLYLVSFLGRLQRYWYDFLGITHIHHGLLITAASNENQAVLSIYCICECEGTFWSNIGIFLLICHWPNKVEIPINI